MTRFIPPHLRSEAGIASTVAVLVMTAMMIFAATVFTRSVQLGTSQVKETSAQRAFDAADAGLDLAVRRLTFLGPGPGQCVTTTVSNPSVGGWCAQTPEESMGSETFSYRVSRSPVPSGKCVGAPAPAGMADRCIVAIGKSNGVVRRLETRVATKGGPMDPIFYMGATFGRELVKLESDTSIESDLTTNGKFEVKKNVKLTGTVYLGPNAPKPRGWTGAVTRMTTNAFVANPDFGNTSTVNNNASIPATSYNAATRTLTVKKNTQVTLSPGVYNFCKIVLEGRGILNTAGSGVNPVRLYLDSPDRPGSGCPPKTGTLSAAGKSGFANPSLDPTAFQIIAWGTTAGKKSSKLTIPLGKKGTLAAAIVAPNSDVRFRDAGVLIGGVTGKRVYFKRKMRFVADTRMTSYTLTTLPTSFRLAWRQCRAEQDNNDPDNGCA